MLLSSLQERSLKSVLGLAQLRLPVGCTGEARFQLLKPLGLASEDLRLHCLARLGCVSALPTDLKAFLALPHPVVQLGLHLLTTCYNLPKLRDVFVDLEQLLFLLLDLVQALRSAEFHTARRAHRLNTNVPVGVHYLTQERDHAWSQASFSGVGVGRTPGLREVISDYDATEEEAQGLVDGGGAILLPVGSALEKALVVLGASRRESPGRMTLRQHVQRPHLRLHDAVHRQEGLRCDPLGLQIAHALTAHSSVPHNDGLSHVAHGHPQRQVKALLRR
mmetsp:Transcript_101601/g.227054  ORF Transcript_101601/g.227054 Transcript_101601/m.227054 type:complete len:277 (+) Transcript_101601:1451-2281(+)